MQAAPELTKILTKEIGIKLLGFCFVLKVIAETIPRKKHSIEDYKWFNYFCP